MFLRLGAFNRMQKILLSFLVEVTVPFLQHAEAIISAPTNNILHSVLEFETHAYAQLFRELDAPVAPIVLYNLNIFTNSARILRVNA